MHESCREIVERGPGRTVNDFQPCGEPGEGVALAHTRAGTLLTELQRGPVRAGPYCAAHGGRERADAEAHRHWDYLAPDSVGHRGKVQAAGCMGLVSPDAYLVLRRVPDEQRPALWTVRMTREQRDVARARERSLRTWSSDEGPNRQLAMTLGALGLGTGTCVTTDEGRARRVVELAHRYWGVDLAVAHRPAGTQTRKRPWAAQLGVGSFLLDVGAYGSRDEALTAGRIAWRGRLDTDVATIRAARGGTLDWGIPVTPLAEPIVLEPELGVSAWDAVGQARRVTPAGLAVLSGARASGEAL